MLIIYDVDGLSMCDVVLVVVIDVIFEVGVIC